MSSGLETGAVDAATAVPTSLKQDLSWSLFGRLGMTAANALLTLTLGLFLLDVGTFGAFAALIGAQLVLSRFVLLGLDQGVVRLYTTDRCPEEVVRACLAVVGLLSIPVLIGCGIGYAIDPFDWHPLAWPAIAAGAIGTALFDLVCAIELAQLRYRRAGSIQAGVPIARLLVTLLAAACTPADSVIPFIAFSGFGFVAGLALFVAEANERGWHVSRAAIFSVAQYGKWIGVGDAAMALALYLGVFLLRYFHQDAEAGRFAFAQQLTLGFFAVYLAFYHTILPRAARIQSIDDVGGFLRRVYRTARRLLVVLLIAIAIGALLGPPLVAWIRPELDGFLAAFVMLSLFQMVLILEAPLGVICQFMLRPRRHVFAMVVRVVAIAGLGWLLIGPLGAFGAGLAQTGGAALALGLLAWLVARAVRQRRAV